MFIILKFSWSQKEILMCSRIENTKIFFWNYLTLWACFTRRRKEDILSSDSFNIFLVSLLTIGVISSLSLVNLWILMSSLMSCRSCAMILSRIFKLAGYPAMSEVWIEFWLNFKSIFDRLLVLTYYAAWYRITGWIFGPSLLQTSNWVY